MFLNNVIDDKKKCKKCNEEKKVEEFPISDAKKGKLIKPFCKICFNQIERERYFKKNKDKIEKRKEKQVLSKQQYNQQYYEKNKNKILEQTKKYSNENKEKISQRQSDYYKKNREVILQKIKDKREYINEYVKEKRKQDVSIKIAHNLRVRIRCAIKKNMKWKKSKEVLGCDMETFKKYLESNFKEGMNWENYGSYWHIDHIKPCASFDLSLKEQQEKCFHYTNLQPLTAKENQSKSDKE